MSASPLNWYKWWCTIWKVSTGERRMMYATTILLLIIWQAKKKEHILLVLDSWIDVSAAVKSKWDNYKETYVSQSDVGMYALLQRGKDTVLFHPLYMWFVHLIWPTTLAAFVAREIEAPFWHWMGSWDEFETMSSFAVLADLISKPLDKDVW